MSELGSRLALKIEARQQELEEAIVSRVGGISAPTGVDDPQYVTTLRSAVSVALAHGIRGLASGEPPPVPAELLIRARDASRLGVGLDTVLRRYLAGYALFSRCLIEEAVAGGLIHGPDLTRMFGIEERLLDDLFVAVSAEYGRETERRHRDLDRRRADQARRVLAGELVDPDELSYGFDAWHLGVIVAGPGAVEAIRRIATALGARLLIVRPDDGTGWAWLGSRRKIDGPEALRVLRGDWPAHAIVAVGEPGEGLHGWRLSHRQAQAAMTVVRHRADRIVLYADVRLLASALRDELLARSLRERYLAPLERGRDEGVALRQTLRTYLAAGRNASSAAASLAVSRQTVNTHVRAAEERIGQSLNDCAAELEVALSLQGLDGGAAPPATG